MDFVDVPLDIGPEWIHTDPVILQELLQFNDTVDIDKKKVAYTPQTWSVYSHGRMHPRNWIKYLYKEYKFWNRHGMHTTAIMSTVILLIGCTLMLLWTRLTTAIPPASLLPQGMGDISAELAYSLQSQYQSYKKRKWRSSRLYPSQNKVPLMLSTLFPPSKCGLSLIDVSIQTCCSQKIYIRPCLLTKGTTRFWMPCGANHRIEASCYSLMWETKHYASRRAFSWGIVSPVHSVG